MISQGTYSGNHCCLQGICLQRCAITGTSEMLTANVNVTLELYMVRALSPPKWPQEWGPQLTTFSLYSCLTDGSTGVALRMASV
jgi:hypothetical protein